MSRRTASSVRAATHAVALRWGGWVGRRDALGLDDNAILLTFAVAVGLPSVGASAGAGG